MPKGLIYLYISDAYKGSLDTFPDSLQTLIITYDTHYSYMKIERLPKELNEVSIRGLYKGEPDLESIRAAFKENLDPA